MGLGGSVGMAIADVTTAGHGRSGGRGSHYKVVVIVFPLPGRKGILRVVSHGSVVLWIAQMLPCPEAVVSSTAAASI